MRKKREKKNENDSPPKPPSLLDSDTSSICCLRIQRMSHPILYLVYLKFFSFSMVVNDSLTVEIRYI